MILKGNRNPWSGAIPKGESPVRTAKVSKSTQKIMATIFWDNGTYYASLLHRLREEIKAKRQRKLARGVLLLQGNAPVHTVAIAKGAVRNCDFTEINHLPYSPDMAPCDYFLFPVFKKDLRGRKFKTDDES
jgi:histone-lysine N-methyltransferase SETMAR